MSRGVNEVRILGNLGQDPEVRYSASGTAVANLSVATSYKPANGEEQTEWHRLVLFGKIAEVCGQYMRKGDKGYFEGRLQTRKWQDKSGADRWSTEIVCHRMEMLTASGGQQTMGPTIHEDPPQAAPRSGPPAQQQPQQQPQQDDGFDDIPF